MKLLSARLLVFRQAQSQWTICAANPTWRSRQTAEQPLEQQFIFQAMSHTIQRRLQLLATKVLFGIGQELALGFQPQLQALLTVVLEQTWCSRLAA
jgi:hypothetical protein